MLGHSALNPSLSSSFCLEAKRLFIAMSEQPDPTRKKLINDLFKGLKEDGILDKMDNFGFLSSHSLQSGLLNWKNPEVFVPELSGTPPSFTTDRGFTGNGTDAYVDSNFNPSTQGENFQLNNQSFGCYNLTNTSGFMVDMGCGDASALEGIFANDGGVAYSYAGNLDPGTSSVIASSIGLTSTVRTDSGTFDLYKNGVLIDSEATASDHMPNYNFFLLGRNQLGSLINPSDRQMAFYFFGSGGIDQLKLYNRVITYLTGIGAI